jgi:hypothetical protein
VTVAPEPPLLLEPAPPSAPLIVMLTVPSTGTVYESETRLVLFTTIAAWTTATKQKIPTQQSMQTNLYLMRSGLAVSHFDFIFNVTSPG